MNINDLYYASEQLESTIHWTKDFLSDMTESPFPMNPEQIRAIKILSEEDWPRVWQPDYALMTLRRWQKTRDFDAMAEIATFQQKLGLPATFIRYFNQLNPDLFPVQTVIGCELCYGTEIVLPEYKPSEDEAKTFFYGRTFTRVKDFLASLPIDGMEKVFVARSSPQTLILEWQLFVEHWDVFYCDRFCTLNVINATYDWFIFAHPDRPLIWGCTNDYASHMAINLSRFCPVPVNNELELPKARNEFAAFFRKLVDEYLHI